MRRILLTLCILTVAAFVLADSGSVPTLVSETTDNLKAKQYVGLEKMQKKWQFLDFEGVGNLEPVGEAYPGLYFSDTWFGLMDSDAGGNGNISFEPSESTVVFTPDDDTSTVELFIGTIRFDEPVAGIGFHYAAISQLVIGYPLQINLYDELGLLLGSYTGTDTPIFTGGDPEGAFSEWYSMQMTITSNSVSTVEFIGPGSYWAIDDFRYMRYKDKK
ncbi:hypothetical protein ACFLU6_02260 [Acidobacteriota bacterium]